MGPKAKFQDGEKVLCFHGPLLYEAKCVKSESRDRLLHYFVHYNGWNKNWDEWVPETRILKHNDVGLQKQKECLNALKAEKAKNKEKAKESGHAVSGKKDKKKEKETKDRSATPTVDTAKHKQKGSAAAAATTTTTTETEKSTPTSSGKSKREREKVVHTQEPTIEKERTSRSSTPTQNITTKRAKDTLLEKDRSSRSSTPTTSHPAKRQKVERAAATAAASQIAQQSSQSSSQPSSQETTTTSAPSTAPSTPSIPASQASTEQKRKRARMDQTVESEESYLTKIELRVKIPNELKPWLVDDWDLVTRLNQLVTLPCKNTVNSILDDYLQLKLTKPNHPDRDIIIEVNNGIREYFNVMLGTHLLYKFERPQYGQVLAEHEGKEMSSIYGATHLLRLFVKLGGMLAYTTLSEKSIQILLHHIHDFLKYMQNNCSTLFNASDYHVASPEYHRKAI